jgi:CheY-like chemotaxis protein
MPVMDGLELAKSINADPALSGTKLLMLSSMGDVRGAALARETSIDGCLTKPARQSELYDCLIDIMNDGAAPVELAPTSQRALMTGGGATILIAEDNVVNQQVARGVLGQLGYTADVVSNGHEAVAAVAARPYAAILMDCQMPELDGFAATRAIRRDEKHGARIPIIAVTADVIGDVRQACLAAGMDDYISKPLDPRQLGRILAHFVPHDAAPDRAEDPCSTLLQRLGEFDRRTPGLGQRIAALFIADGHARLEELATALANGDAGQVAAIAHALHGSAANVGAADMAAASASIERLGRAGSLDSAQGAFDVLCTAFEQACQALCAAGMAAAEAA